MSSRERELRDLREEIESLKTRLSRVERRRFSGLYNLPGRSIRGTRILAWLALTLIVLPAAVYAATVSMPYTFVNGTVADATEVNGNFNALVTESNAQDSRIATVEADTANHAADTSAHHSKYTDPEAIAAILAADGSGSGLDADLLDGLDESAFVKTGDSYTKAEVDALLASINGAIATNTTDIATLIGNYLPCATQVGNEVYFEGCNVNLGSAP